MFINNKCYGCKTTDPEHHGWFCEFAGDSARDLPCYASGDVDWTPHDRIVAPDYDNQLTYRQRNQERNLSDKGRKVHEHSSERLRSKMALPGYVVLGAKPGDNGFLGLVEGSFSLDSCTSRTQFFWTSDNATSNFGGTFKVDGLKNAEHAVSYWHRKLPQYDFKIFDARDDKTLPVHLNWIKWLRASRRADTLSGVENKYGARNLEFEPK